MDFFAEMGCCVSDHALEYVMYAPASEEKTDEIFKKSLKGEGVSREEEMIFKTAFMQFVGKAYHEKNWVMQIHYGCKRDNKRFFGLHAEIRDYCGDNGQGLRMADGRCSSSLRHDR